MICANQLFQRESASYSHYAQTFSHCLLSAER